MNMQDIINQNTGLIYKISKMFYGVDKEDLYQAGILGLMKAYKNYNSNENTKFSTYAYDYIYGEMYLLANSKIVKINRDTLKLYKLIEKTKDILTQKNSIIPTYEEIAKFLKIDKSKIYDAVMSGQSIMSLDNDDHLSYYETIKAPEHENVDNHILINESLNYLTEDERNIIKSRYLEDLTQSEVARKLSMTQVMVSRYEKKGLNKMHEFMTL